MNRHPWCWLVLALSLAGCSAPAERPPNIVFIVADDLGYGHLGIYGQQHIETPNIDQLAADGMRFTQAYAGATVCAPSRSVLLTGQHGGNTPIRRNGGGSSLEPDDVTIAEVMREAGYATGGYGKWGLGLNGYPGHPNSQGFDEFVGYLHQVHAHFFYPYWLAENEGQLMLPENEGGQRGRYSHDVLVERAMDFMRDNRDRPFFAYLPVTIPHVELAVPDDSLAQYSDRWEETPGFQERRAGYIVSETPKATLAAMISRLDRDVGRIVELVQELGLEEDTIIIFTSDNGAQSGFDVNQEFFEASGPLRGFKGSMYDGGLRVPLIVRWPGRVEAGAVSDHVTYFPDYMPTFAELAGLDTPVSDGLSIVSTLLGRSNDQPVHDWLYWELVDGDGNPTRRAARHLDWKFVQNRMTNSVELYDLATDVGEQNDLAIDRTDLVEQFEAWFGANRTPSRTWQDIPPTGVADYVR